MEDTEKDNFELWHDAGHKYAADHPELELWEFQVKAMASDFAWRMEGMEITDENVQYAYDDWISGKSPYSVHSRATARSIEEGYDFMEQCRRDRVKAQEKAAAFAVEEGMDPREARLFSENCGIELYFYADRGKMMLKDWYSGKNEKSPHHVPLDPENKALRDERLALMRKLYGPKRGSFSDLFYFGGVHPPVDIELLRKTYAEDYEFDKTEEA